MQFYGLERQFETRSIALKEVGTYVANIHYASFEIPILKATGGNPDLIMTIMTFGVNVLRGTVEFD